MLWATPIVFAIGVPVNFFGHWLSSSASGKHDILPLLYGSVMWAAGFALLFTGSSLLFRGKRDAYRYTLTIDNDEMCMKLNSSASYSFLHTKRQVRRDQIRTIYERKGYLVVSKYSRLATFFRGAVLIPKQLPEYESLKNVALSWKTESREPGSL